MSAVLSQFLTEDSSELEKYIKQIKSYEAQSEIIEAAAAEEERLKKSRPNWLLVLWTGIAGIWFHVDLKSDSGKELLASLVPGTELNLVRDRDNKYDRWAIAIHTQEGQMLGYVTRYKNESIARLMDHGFRFHAFVENEMQVNFQAPEQQRARTENFILPFSVWME